MKYLILTLVLVLASCTTEKENLFETAQNNIVEKSKTGDVEFEDFNENDVYISDSTGQNIPLEIINPEIFYNMKNNLSEEHQNNESLTKQYYYDLGKVKLNCKIRNLLGVMVKYKINLRFMRWHYEDGLSDWHCFNIEDISQ